MHYRNGRDRPVFISILAAGLMAIFLPAPQTLAVDEATGTYLGFGWGRHKIEMSPTSDIEESSKRNSTLKFLVGYELIRNFFSMEIGNTGFNNLSLEHTAGDVTDVDTESYFAKANLQIPVSWGDNSNTVMLYLSGGAHRWDEESVRRDAGGGMVGRSRGHDVDTLYGVGLLIKGLGQSALRLDYELYKNVGVNDPIDLRLWSINLIYYYQ